MKVSGALADDAQRLRLVRNGVPFGEPVDVVGDPFVYETIVTAPAAGEERWRAEVLFEGKPLTVTSHVWLKLDVNGARAEEVAPGGDGGCAMIARDTDRDLPILGGALALLGVALLRARRRG